MKHTLIVVFLLVMTTGSFKHHEKLYSGIQTAQTVVNKLSQLDGRWSLDSLDGAPIDTGSQEAFLVFHSAEKRFSGYVGCNRFNGQIEMEKTDLVIGRIMATKKFCPENQLEDRLLNLLPESRWVAELENGALKLHSSPHILILRKKEN